MAIERLDEKAFNVELASALRKHLRDTAVDAEMAGKLLDLPGREGAKPDISVSRPGRGPVVIEIRKCLNGIHRSDPMHKYTPPQANSAI